MSRILIVDDEKDICFLISEVLSDERFITDSALNSSEALHKFNIFKPDLVILDVWLGKSELDGIELLKKFKELNPLIPIVIISGHGTVNMAVNAIKNGAYDFIEKPFNSEKIMIVSKRAIESAKLIKENNILKIMAEPKTPLIGNSIFINKLRKDIVKIANSNSRVLISGKNGTGKKLIAQLIHKNSIHLKSLPIIINFKNISEQELNIMFSEEENINQNILSQSNNNTLILDNIDFLPIIFQKKLLFYLENTTLFEQNKIHLNIKIITITSKDILTEIESGNFIKMLFDRLSTIHFKCPSINERREDIVPICDYYLDYYNKNNNHKITFSENAKMKLKIYDWPGNVSQIINYVEKTLILNQDMNSESDFEIENLPLDMGENIKQDKVDKSLVLSLKEARQNFEKEYFLSQLKRFNGNISKVSEFTGMERTALYRKFKSLDISINIKK